MNQVDASQAELKIKGIEIKAPAQARMILLRFAAYMMQQTGMTFRALSHGGTYRGVTWKPFAKQYTRKTDGVTVPAWGGVAKLRGQGVVQGRKRPSGQWVTQTSNLMRDTGIMAAAAGSSWRFENQNHRIIMSTEGPAKKYAPRQQALRPFLFFHLPNDLTRFKQIADEVIHR